jgi:hypothetical protein
VVQTLKNTAMRTIQTTVYTFDELTEKAQQKAIENLYDINIDHNWWGSTYEDAEQIGLKITSFDLDRNRHATGDFLLNAAEVAQNILNNHGPDCSTFKTATAFLEEWQPVFNNYMNENHEDYESRDAEGQLQDIEGEFLNSLLEDYSILLQNESEYLQSREAIIEIIQANEYEFTEDGKLI